MLTHAGRYEIQEELGRGGFGRVYRAWDPNLASTVAVKTLTVDNDPAVLARFRNEAAASRRLRHPNIVTIYDFGEQDGVPFIVMELLEGEDLQRIIKNRRPLPLWHKLQIMTQVGSGLGHAHRHGIVHRDVKPANIMLLPDGNIKIMDFGIALISHDTQNRLTPRGAMVGTLRYMAPEQFRGAEQDARGDIFACGLMFYELLSGVHPFHASDPAALMYNVLNLEPVPIHEACPECPESVQAVISRLLQKDPELRYQHLEDAVFDCEPILNELKRARSRDLLEAARSARSGGQLDTAQALLRQVMELDPAYPGIRELRDDIQNEIRRIAVRPRIDALVNEAREYLSASNPAEAVSKLDAAIRLDPTDSTLRSYFEQAQASLERLRQVDRLVSDAQQALEAGDLTGANRIAQQASEMAPSQTRAKEIFARTQSALTERERQTQFAENLSRSRRLIEIHSWDEGSAVLDRLEQDFPDVTEIRTLRETLEAGRLVDQRQQRLASGLVTARQQIQTRDLGGAQARLKELRSEFPDSPDVQQLLLYVNSEIEEQAKREAVDRSLRTARELTDKNQWVDAAKILETALESYPTDTLLVRELRSVSTARQQAERQAARSQAVSSANTLRAQGGFDQAARSLEAFLAEYGADPAIEELWRAIERDREAARRAAEQRELIRRVRDLLEQEKPEEATRLLQNPSPSIGDNPELTQLRTLAQGQLERQNERRVALQNALGSADQRGQAGDFAGATQILGAFTQHFGADPKIADLGASLERKRQEAERQQQEAERKRQETQRRAEELTRIVGQANSFLEQGNALEATRILQSRPALKDEPNVTKLLDLARNKVREQAAREEALNAALSSAASLQNQGRIDEALAWFQRFTAKYGSDARVVEAERAIERDREAARRLAEMVGLAEQTRTFLAQNNPESAIALLKDVPNLVEESPDLRQLMQAAEATIAAQKTREAVEAAISEARAQSDRGDFQSARAVVDRALASFPNESALESARKEIEELSWLISRTTSLLELANAVEANRILRSAPPYLKDDPNVARLLGRSENVLREQADREAALNTALSSAASLQSQGMIDEALAELQLFTAKFGSNPRIVEAEQAIARDREAARQLAEIVGLAEQTRTFLAQNNPESAIILLKDAHSLVEQSPDLRQLMNAAEAAIAAHKKREAVDATLAETRTLSNRGELDAALAAIDRGLERFPGESALQSARTEIVAAQTAKRNEEYRARSIAEIHRLLGIQEYDRATNTLKEALAKLPGDAQLLPLNAEIETRRREWNAAQVEQSVRDSLLRGQELLAKKPGEAVVFLDRLSAQHPNRLDVTALLGSARQAQREHEDAQRQIEEQKRQLEEQKRAAAESERIAKAIQAATENAAKKPAQALRALERLQRVHPQRPEIGQAIEDCQALLRGQALREEERKRTKAQPPQVAEAPAAPGAAGRKKLVWVAPAIAAVILVAFGIRLVTHHADVTTVPETTAVNQPNPPGPVPGNAVSSPATSPAASSGTSTGRGGQPGTSKNPTASTSASTTSTVPNTGKSSTTGGTKSGGANPATGTEVAGNLPGVVLPPTQTGGQNPNQPSTPPPTPTSTQPPQNNPQTPVAPPSIPNGQTQQPAVTLPAPNPALPPPPPSPVKPSATQPPAESADQQAVRSVVSAVAAAYSKKDFSAFAASWPAMKRNTDLQKAFLDRNYTVMEYSLTPLSAPAVQGNQAQVKVHRETRTRDPKARPKPEIATSTDVLVTLQKSDGQWTIVDMK